MEEERLTPHQEDILYTLSLRQDELERSPSFMMLSELESNPKYRELLDGEYLTYQKMGRGDKAVASLIVTLKGIRYCVKHIDEISVRIDTNNLAVSMQESARRAE